MKLSYSRINCFRQCPYQYDLRYNQKLKTIYNCDPGNALTLGTAIHTGIEHDVNTAIQQYYDTYPIINDLHIHETIKFEHLLPRVKELLPDGEYEIKLDGDDFVGYVDLISDISDIYDFKYSNAIDRYMESEQLHLYKYFYEKLNPGQYIYHLYYVFVPKTMIRQKKTEDLQQFRKRLNETLKGLEIKIIEVTYDPNKVINFLLNSKKLIEATEFPKNPTRLCDWCEYQNYCESDGSNDIDIIYPDERS